jgi:hypothetical protein
MKGIDVSPPSTCRQGRAKWTYLNANGRPVTNGRRIDARLITTCLTAQCFASRNLKDWATPDEVEAAITELRELWKRIGKEMMAAKAKAGGAWDRNWFDRTDVENALCAPIIVAQDARATINAIVKLLKEARIPDYLGGYVQDRAKLDAEVRCHDGQVHGGLEIRRGGILPGIRAASY